MPSLGLLESPHAWHVVVFLASILEALLHLRVKLGLIAFDRQHVIGERAIKRAYPSLQAGIELGRVESSKHSAKCVVRWDVAGKLEKPGKPFLLLLAESLDISPSAPQIAAHKAMTTISISR